MPDGKQLTHREACYELRRVAQLLARGVLNLDSWFGQVSRILRQRYPYAPSTPRAPAGARP